LQSPIKDNSARGGAMSNAALPARTGVARRLAPLQIRVSSVQRAVLWLFIACSCVAFIEPSPYEFMFLMAALVFARSGLRFDRVLIPMIVTLAMFNAGGLLALVPWVQERESVTFVAISVYVAITAIFFAALVAENPGDHMRTIRSGYVLAAVIAAFLGILGYFNVAGLGYYFTLYDNSRASGPFKDPNVFGPFLVLPIIWLTQDILLKRGAGLLRSLPLILIMLLGLLLSFSRGAWGAAAASIAMLVALTFLTTSSAAQRQRIVMISALGLSGLVAFMAIALSIPAIRDIFLLRASLNQDYDLGELGRFGAQARSIPMLLERPFGFGPLRYDAIFPAAPHEVYINAFASYGWLGGLSFVAFTGITLYIGCRLVFQRSRVQTEALAIWASLLPQMVQGFQIDTDHWRHLYLMFGCLYGLAAAARIERQRGLVKRDRPASRVGEIPDPVNATAST
jgi:hypothetical protein